MEARQGPRRRPTSSTASSPRWSRGCASLTVLLHPVPARPRPSSCSPRSAARDGARRAPRSRAPRRCASSALEPLFPKRATATRDRLPHPSDRCEPPDARARRPRRRAAGVDAHAHVGTDGATLPRGARRRPRRFPQVYAAVGRHPNSAHGLRRRRPRRAARARRAPALRRDRRDRAGLLPRPRAARRPGARVRARRSSSRARPASRSSSTPARPRTTRSRMLARPRRRRERDHALLLDARPARRVPRARLVDLVRRQRHLPERGARRGRASACPPTACSSRPTRRT